MRFQKQINNIIKSLLLTVVVAIPIFGYRLPLSQAAEPIPLVLEKETGHGYLSVSPGEMDAADTLPQHWLTPANTGEPVPPGLQAASVMTPTCSTSNVAIPDGSISPPFTNTVTDTMVVVSTETISDLNVSISTTHTSVVDLSFTLKHVDTGTSVTIIDKPGFGTTPCNGFAGNHDIDAILDDEASSPVESACDFSSTPTISGTFSPTNTLSTFDGEVLSGTWQMIVSDSVFGDTGTLIEWCLQSDPDFAISKTRLTTSPVGVGQTVDFQIAMTNTSGTALTTIPLTDTFDSNFLAFSSATSTPDTVNASQLLWNNIGPLAVGQSVTLTVQFTATNVAAGTTNTATASAIDLNAMSVAQKSDSATVAVNAGSVPDFAITKTVISTHTLAVSQTLDFQIAVTNTGSTTLTTISLTDTFDSNTLAFSSAISSPDTVNAGQLLWNDIGPLAVGQGVTVTIHFTVTAITNSITNTATASAVDIYPVAVAPKSATATLSSGLSIYLPIVLKN